MDYDGTQAEEEVRQFLCWRLGSGWKAGGLDHGFDLKQLCPPSFRFVSDSFGFVSDDNPPFSLDIVHLELLLFSSLLKNRFELNPAPRKVYRKAQNHKMKYLLPLFALLTLACSSHAFAQPGDPDLEHRLRWFNAVQDSVIAYPDDPYYRWARLDLLFSPQFDLNTAPREELKDYLWHSSQYGDYVRDSLVYSFQPCDMCRFESVKRLNPATKLGAFLLNNQEQLVSDLTWLIASDLRFEAGYVEGANYIRSANKASFYYKRAQFYYLTGRSEAAEEDYLQALEHQPDADLKQSIYISLAAYYFQEAPSEREDHYPLALQYLQLIEPCIEDSTFSKGKAPAEYVYERERLALMKQHAPEDYLRYLQNRSLGYLNHYYFLLAGRDVEGERASAIETAHARSWEYEQMIYAYLLERFPDLDMEALKRVKKEMVERL
jgi:hypothetical protein